MKKNTSWWLVFLLLFPTSLFAQDKGVHFEHGLTWAQLQAKAQAEHKYIFIDCFTSWCGPCKMMAQIVFPQEVAGDFFNKNFISVKMQMDTTASDDQDIKLLYEAASKIRKEYHVVAYPTFLFFSPDGHIIHRITGGDFPASRFVEQASEALDPSKQYYTLMKDYNANPNIDPEEIRKLALLANRNYDTSLAENLSTAYLATQPDIYTKKNVEFMCMLTKSSNDKSFKAFLDHPDKIDSVMGRGIAAQNIQDIALQEDYSNITIKAFSDWKTQQAKLEIKYPRYSKEIIARFKIRYYLSEKNWDKLASAMRQYVSLYRSDIPLAEMDGIAQDIFDNCPDKNCLQAALEWSKIAKDEGFLSSEITYASLLYKTGDQGTAVILIERIVKKMNFSDGSLQEQLAKMKKRQKIWTNP
jgi:thiol-disulfide isomerase/thioredoxin